MNEYQRKAKEYRNKMLTVSLSEFGVKCILWGSQRDCTYRLCCINGEKYIPANDLVYIGLGKFDTMVKNGIFNKDDIFRFISKGRIVRFVKVSKAVDNLNRIVKTLDDGIRDYTSTVLLDAQKADVPDGHIPADALYRSQEANRLRNEMQKQSDRLEDVRRREEKEIERKSEMENDMLRTLVAKIEALGWNVTLTLKNE